MNPDSPKGPSAQRLRSRFKEATQEAILDAAAEVFAEQGLQSARMEEIARRAGVAVGTLYNHFEDRESLLTTLVHSRRAELLQRMDDALEEHKAKPIEQQLRGLIESTAQHFVRHQCFRAIVQELEGMPDQAPLILKLGRNEIHDAINARIAEVVKRGVASGELRSTDTDLFPLMLRGILHWVLKPQLVESTSAEMTQQRIDQILRFFMRGAGA
jgi:AcrR family transcriptional regulator